VFRFACALLLSAVVAASSSAVSSGEAAALHDSSSCPAPALDPAVNGLGRRTVAEFLLR
jgi:hypothetical protein